MRRPHTHDERHPQVCAGGEAMKNTNVIGRRNFLKGAGVMVVGFSAWGVGEFAAPAPGLNGTGSNALDSWLSLAADGNVTVYTGKCELGQGLFTAQAQL